MFLFCFSRNCNNHRTGWSLESSSVAKSETELVSQLKLLAQRPGKRCLHFLQHSFLTDEAHVIREVHHHERSGTSWTVTDCKIRLYPSTDDSLEKTLSAAQGFLSPPSYLHRCDKGSKEVFGMGGRNGKGRRKKTNPNPQTQPSPH